MYAYTAVVAVVLAPTLYSVQGAKSFGIVALNSRKSEVPQHIYCENSQGESEAKKLI